MRWSAYRCSVSLLCLVFAFAFVALSPSDAFAMWDEATATKELHYWSNSSSAPSTLKVSPIYTEASAQGYGNIIFGSMRYVSSSNKWYGTAWNSVPSVSSPVLVRFKSIEGGQLAEGQRFMIGDTGQYLISYTTVASPSGSSDYHDVTLNGSNFRYFVSETGNANKTEIYPDANGTFTAPFDVQYVFITSNVSLSNVSGAKFWYVFHDFSILIERPEDQNEVAAINNQTETFMDTTGSDTVGSDAVSQGQQIVQGVDFIQQTGQLVTATFNVFNTASAQTGLRFPGLTIMGYTIIQPQDVSFTGYLGTELENQIRDAVTLVLFLAWVMGLRSLYHRMFLGEVEVDVVEE